MINIKLVFAPFESFGRALQDSSLQFPQLRFTYFRFLSTEVAHHSGPFPFVPFKVQFLYSIPLNLNGNWHLLFLTFPELVVHGGAFFKESAY